MKKWVLCTLVTLLPSVSNAATDIHTLPKEKENLTPEKQAGALMMIGIHGKKILPSTRQWIRDRGVGSVILFPKNIGTSDELKALTSELQTLTPASSLLVAVDQEGGRVRRLQKDVTFLPSAMSLGSASNPSLSYLSGMVAGKELLHLGINVNLAPVLDIYFSRQDGLIGTRSFGPSPATVGTMGAAYIRALQFHGVSATAKHFPGHGNVMGDSHYTLPISDVSLQNWKRIHAPPFLKAIEENVHLIMTAHVRFPRLLKELGASEAERQLPATMSPTLIDKMLRQEMGFQGVVVTDDLEMHAIRKQWSYGEAAVRAIEAGSDIVMVAWGPHAKDEVWKSLRDAIQSGRISQERVRQSLDRIAKVRQTKEHLLEAGASTHHVLRNPVHQEAVSMIRNMGLASFETRSPQSIKSLRLPVTTPLKIYANHSAIVDSLKALLRTHFKASIHTFSLDQLKSEEPPSPTTAHIFLIRNRNDKSTLQSHWSQWNHADKLTYVVSMDSPALLVGFEDAQGLLCTFNNDALSLKSLAAFFMNHLELTSSLVSLKRFN